VLSQLTIVRTDAIGLPLNEDAHTTLASHNMKLWIFLSSNSSLLEALQME
jgi:hypothetical protein